MCCAYCGPDDEVESNKLTVKFLDLSRVTGDDEYEHEGLTICIKWFIGILEAKNTKKDIETVKKLKGILEDFDKAIKEQQNLARASLQAFPPISNDPNIDDAINSDANLARSVFNQDPELMNEWQKTFKS